MYFMNQYEIEIAVQRHASHPVLGKATRFLKNFMDEVNSHSDGWAYWRPPVHAAKQLMTLVHSGTATEDAFRKALTPIRSFYTRRGTAAGMSLPSID